MTRATAPAAPKTTPSRRAAVGAALTGLCLGLSACSTGSVPSTSATSSTTVGSVSSTNPLGPGTTAGGTGATSTVPSASSAPTGTTASSGPSLIVEPDQGLGPVDASLSSATHSLDMVMYELVDTEAESILAADAARGVRVRVVLDRALEQSHNQAAFDYLAGHGVAVHWAPVQFHAEHEKAWVLDGRTAVIGSMNLTSRYYSDTRDLLVVDSDPTDVAAVESGFQADYSGSGATHLGTGADLLWSPGSEGPMVSLVEGAQRSLVLESEELSDTDVVDALVAAAHRGVDVTVVMTYDSEYRRAFEQLTAAGAHVRTYSPNAALYIHAKAMVIDGRLAFVGSENLSYDSLEADRELGLVTTTTTIVQGAARVLASDAARATPYSG